MLRSRTTFLDLRSNPLPLDVDVDTCTFAFPLKAFALLLSPFFLFTFYSSRSIQVLG